MAQPPLALEADELDRLRTLDSRLLGSLEEPLAQNEGNDNVVLECEENSLRGSAWHRGSILASHPAGPGSNHSVPEKISEEKLSMLLGISMALVRGKWLENVALVLTSGKPVLEKTAVSQVMETGKLTPASDLETPCTEQMVQSDVTCHHKEMQLSALVFKNKSYLTALILFKTKFSTSRYVVSCDWLKFFVLANHNPTGYIPICGTCAVSHKLTEPRCKGYLAT